MPRLVYECPRISRLLTLAALGLLAVSSARPTHAQTVIANRVTQQVDETSLVKLKGNTHPLARAQYDRGPANASLPGGRMMLVLKRSAQQEADLQQYLSSLQDKASPNYHKFITPEEFGQLYGVSDQDLQAVNTWLQTRGFTVEDTSKAKNIVVFSGSVGQVQSAFHTSIHSFEVNGEQHYANTVDPSIPAALAPVVAGIAHLNNFKPRANAKIGPRGQFDPATHRFQPQLTGGAGTSGNPFFLYVGSADAATIYNTPNPQNANFSGTPYDGTGITIGIAGDSNIAVADFNAYRTFFALPAITPSIIIDGGVDPGINGDEIEALLDTEVSGGMAPGAKINLYIAADTTLESGLVLGINRALNDNVINILNISFGSCEANEGAGGNAAIYNLSEQAAAQGITMTVSTGDNGSAGCDNPNTETISQFGLAVSGFASTPFVVAVGGTDYDILGDPTQFKTYAGTSNTAPPFRTALKFIPEEPWNNSPTSNTTIANNVAFKDSTGATNISAASGGQSTCIAPDFDAAGNFLDCGPGGYAKPTWQAGAGVPGDGVRDIPDISFLAANGAYNATWAICADTDCALSGGTLTSSTTVSGVGGTSASAPAFAGMLALINQKVAPTGRLGLVNPILYALAASKPSIFHDVTSGNGNNSVVCTSGIGVDGANDCLSNGFLKGWDTTAGYDLATGLGSADITALANNWTTAANALTATTTALSVSPSPNVTHGTNLTLGVTVTSGATGGVTLTASNNGTFDGSQVSDLTNSKATFANYNALPGGTYNLFANYTGDKTHAASKSAPVAVVIAAEASKVSVAPAFYDAATGQNFPTANGNVPYGFFVVTDIQPYGASSPVSGTSVVPDGTATGTVSMTDGGTTLVPTTTLSSEGFYEDQRTSLALGTHNFTATYSGDSSFLPNTGTSGTFTIVQGASAVSLASSVATTTSAGSITLTATVVTDSLGVNPSGTVTFFSGTKTLGSAVAVVGTVDPKTGLAGATATLTVAGSGLAAVEYPRTPWSLVGGGAALACVLFFGIPARRRSWRGLVALIVFAVTVSAVVGCGGGGSSGGGGGGGGTSFSITAKYSGDTNYAVPTAASNAVTVTVN
jgi:hypothetical protein